ncbi:unnamed protein product [Prorocentrum cordatum]|uniref:Uncharacterized protein n=1 Tax=Prorocentrum cordatum TaxID=2364126 RepID=A0ABN9VET1_9DINO|nr:unnamed protein product [Polarella glacialis]
MMDGQMCEVDTALPDGNPNYNIDNCPGGYDVWQLICTPTPAPTPAPTRVYQPLAVTWPCESHSAWPLSFFHQTELSATGAPIYHSSDAGWYLYYDPGCAGDSAGDDRWIFDDSMPSTTAVSDLDGDGSCRYKARLNSFSTLPPTGSATWRVNCDSTWQDMTVSVSEVGPARLGRHSLPQLFLQRFPRLCAMLPRVAWGRLGFCKIGSGYGRLCSIR